MDKETNYSAKPRGHYCSAINCSNSRETTSLSFFGFPSNMDRSDQWVKNSGRSDLIPKTVDQRQKSHLFCSEHFEMKCFYSSDKKRLIKNAVPTLFEKCEHGPELWAKKTPADKNLQDVECSQSFHKDMQGMAIDLPPLKEESSIAEPVTDLHFQATGSVFGNMKGIVITRDTRDLPVIETAPEEVEKQKEPKAPENPQNRQNVISKSAKCKRENASSNPKRKFVYDKDLQTLKYVSDPVTFSKKSKQYPPIFCESVEIPRKSTESGLKAVYQDLLSFVVSSDSPEWLKEWSFPFDGLYLKMCKVIDSYVSVCLTTYQNQTLSLKVYNKPIKETHIVFAELPVRIESADCAFKAVQVLNFKWRACLGNDEDKFMQMRMAGFGGGELMWQTNSFHSTKCTLLCRPRTAESDICSECNILQCLLLKSKRKLKKFGTIDF